METDPVKFADHAAQQSDRWLLILVLAVCFLCVLWLVRWFISKLDKQNDRADARDARMDNLFDKVNDTNIKVTEALTSTRQTVAQCNDYIQEGTEYMKRSSDQATQCTEVMRQVKDQLTAMQLQRTARPH